MKKLFTIILAALIIIVPVLADESDQKKNADSQQTTRFAPLHIYIDSGGEQLAAYQFEITITTGQAKIVGVEGGQPPAFKQPPYYDPAALSRDRIIIAAFNTGKDLPKGHLRVATVHWQIIGDTEPEYKVDLIVAGSAEGKEIPAEITFKQGDQK